MTVYRIYPARSAKTFLLALAVVTGFLSLFTAPVGWWIAGWLGVLTGIGLSTGIFLLADGMTIREIRTSPKGMIEFRSPWRQIRVDSSDILEVIGFLDHDEGDRSFNLTIRNRPRPIGVDDFPALSTFLDELHAHNPALQLSGEWPERRPAR